jgi:hypothetical protein
MGDDFQVTFTVNRDIFASLRQDPEHFVPELRWLLQSNGTN